MLPKIGFIYVVYQDSQNQFPVVVAYMRCIFSSQIRLVLRERKNEYVVFKDLNMSQLRI
jgi:hypothetical protein